MKKILFVHVPKVAGTSMKVFFKTRENIEFHYYEHQKLRNIPNYKDLFRFSFVRNPYDRFLSSYYFYRDIYPGPRTIRKEINKFKNFNHFCENFNKFSFQHDSQYIPQYQIISNENDEIDLNFLGKYENLKSDWRKLLAKIGLEYEELPLENKSKNSNWIEQYNQTSINLVNKLFYEDFPRLGYKKLS